MEMAPQLAMWPVSGNVTQVTAFQRRLLSSCYSHGEQSQPSHTTLTSGSGLAGVLKGAVIPFLDLPLT